MMRKMAPKTVRALLLILVAGAGIYSAIWSILLHIDSDMADKRERVELSVPVLDAENRAEAERLEQIYGCITLRIDCRRGITITNGQGQSLHVDPKEGLSGNLLVYSGVQYGKSFNNPYDSFELVLCGSDILSADFDGQKGKLVVTSQSGTYISCVSSAHLESVARYSDGHIKITDTSLFGEKYRIGVSSSEERYDSLNDAEMTGRIKGTEAVYIEAPNTVRLEGSCKKWRFSNYVVDWCDWCKETVEMSAPDAEVEYLRYGDGKGNHFVAR